MRFGTTLRKSIYEPWRSNYVDYDKLKKLLREDDSSRPDAEQRSWTEEDEGAFVDELVNVQLEKVNAFQVTTYKHLRERTANCESTLEESGLGDEGKAVADKGDNNTREDVLNRVMQELDGISKEINELEKYSRINFTGFLKAAKKHDRKRGSQYRVRPLLQVRLAALPFNSEDYSPLLYRLSAMYSFVRQRLGGDSGRTLSFSEPRAGGEQYKSHKFWVHLDNLLEVKTYILRRLPVLVYNPQTSKIVEGSHSDPTITSLYFDSPNFLLYTDKLDKSSGASSLRLRWFGHLSDKPAISFEKKTIKEDGDSEEVRFPIKEKYIQPFIKGSYKMEKSLQKLRDRYGKEGAEVKQLEKHVDEIQTFIQKHDLQPVLRANYTRTAFQIPGDNGIRISIDTNLALIREDSLDIDRPCRDPDEWHRMDIDDSNLEFPFTQIKKGEISRFPYALLEIKLQDGVKKSTNEWVTDLMASHLVRDAPRFSKFVHGVTQLFEDHVNSFPFWLSNLDTDIRKDPEDAFQEEQEKKAKRAEDELAVGSLLGSKSASSFKAAVGSPAGRTTGSEYDGLETNAKPRSLTGVGRGINANNAVEEDDSEDDGRQARRSKSSTNAGLRALFPSFSTSKFARAHRQRQVSLPPGVRKPGQLIKDSGTVKVEPKVWLANNRTFIRWLHVSVLLASLSLGLYNAAGEANSLARGLAAVYTLVAVFAGGWGWWMYIVRSRMIERRSGRDFDNVLGPIVVCIGLVVALCLNFGFRYRAVKDNINQPAIFNATDVLIGQMHNAVNLHDWTAD